MEGRIMLIFAISGVRNIINGELELQRKEERQE